ncbi:MAG: hypothetical protein R8P61_25810 [Bacteroidia bacterium]|nr:hypothetical protein [Bacteroidia bacterium]
MLTEDLRNKIQEIVEYSVPGAYLVDVVLNKNKRRVLNIKVDTDAGVSLAECAKISRNIGRELEEEESMSQQYLLEVSSPGVGYPLKLHRQYTKNVGRHLKIILSSGEVEKGTLKALDEEKLILGPLPEKNRRGKKASKKKKAEQPEDRDILFTEIREAKVIII